MLLSRLGGTEFGLWALALSALLVAPALSLGRSLALLSVLPRARAEGSPERQLVILALRPVLACATLAALIASALIAWWRPTVFEGSIGSALPYVLVVVAAVTLTEIDNIISLTLKALGRFQAAAILETAGRTVQVLACVLIVAPGWTATQTLVLCLVVQVVKTACKLLSLSRETLDGAPDTKGSTDATSVIAAPLNPEFFRVGLWNVMQTASGLCFYAYDRWLVGATVGVGAVGAYAICIQYAQLSHSIIAAATQPLIPWAARNSTSGRSRMRGLAFSTAALACIGPVLAWVFAEKALSLWISPSFASEHLDLAHRLCLCYLILALNVPFVNLLYGMGQTHFVASLTLASGVALIGWSVIWTPEDVLGIATLKLAYAVGSLACVLWFWHLTRTPRDTKTSSPAP